MSTHAGVGILMPDGSVEAVYCHHDGYLEYVGKLLFKYYNGTRLIKQLIGYGDFPSLKEIPGDIEFYGLRDSASATYTPDEFASAFSYNYVWVP